VDAAAGLDIMAEASTTTPTGMGHLRAGQEVCLEVEVDMEAAIAQTSKEKVQEDTMIENPNGPGISLPSNDRGIAFFFLSEAFTGCRDPFDRFSYVQVCLVDFFVPFFSPSCLRKYNLRSWDYYCCLGSGE
jgi:cold shock CspA family protein